MNNFNILGFTEKSNLYVGGGRGGGMGRGVTENQYIVEIA